MGIDLSSLPTLQGGIALNGAHVNSNDAYESSNSNTSTDPESWGMLLAESHVQSLRVRRRMGVANELC